MSPFEGRVRLAEAGHVRGGARRANSASVNDKLAAALASVQFAGTLLIRLPGGLSPGPVRFFDVPTRFEQLQRKNGAAQGNFSPPRRANEALLFKTFQGIVAVRYPLFVLHCNIIQVATSDGRSYSMSKGPVQSLVSRKRSGGGFDEP